jgi:hypothetical protein
MTTEQSKKRRDQFCVKQFHTEWLQSRGFASVFRSPINLHTSIQTALIVIDSGFNAQAMKAAGKIMAFADLTTGNIAATSEGALSESDLKPFAGDPLNHGSVVLAGGNGFTGLSDLMPDSPFILIRAFGTENKLIRTEWQGGTIVRPGWTEAYRWAVEFCRQHNMSSVANCSFGGFAHAMDGTGWEARQLAMETGAGKPGHIVVSATGPGDAAGLHASWSQAAGEMKTVTAEQKCSSSYNLWSAEPPTARTSDFARFAAWKLHVFRDGKLIEKHDAANIPNNLWNQRKQLKLIIEGAGHIQFVLTRDKQPHWEKSISRLQQRFDCWVESGDAMFRDHIDPVAISEPAIFPHVLAVGFDHCNYSPDQMQPNGKPDILLTGDRQTPISFRTPVISASVARLFNSGQHHLDLEGVKAILGKSGSGTAGTFWQRDLRSIGRRQGH